MIRIIETAVLGIQNRIMNEKKQITESALSNIPISNVRAVFPMINAINSDRLTRNYTFYPRKELIGSSEAGKETGYTSFVKPHGKPILREHRSQDSVGLFGSGIQAEAPMGRIVAAGYKKRSRKDGMTKCSNPLFPGTLEGNGSLFVVPAITDTEAINKVLGGTYYTVSIGCMAESVVESISGSDLAAINRGDSDEEFPPYERGQVYDNELSYWSMGGIKGIELSFVNVPSDEYAFVTDPDIGFEGIRLLLGEKEKGAESLTFYDAKTKEKVELDLEYLAYDNSFPLDSILVGENTWVLSNSNTGASTVTESAQGEKDMATLKKKILKSLNDKEALESLSTEQDFPEALKEVLSDITLDGVQTEFATLFLAGESLDGFNIENPEGFKEAQDLALGFTEDLNEETVKLLFHFYKEGLTKIEDPNRRLKANELYPEGSDVELNITVEEFNKMDETIFLGENKTYPVWDMASALFASANTNSKELKQKIAEKAKEFGVLIKQEKDKEIIEFVALRAGDKDLYKLSFSETEDIESYGSSLGLDQESIDQMKEFAEVAKTISEAEDLAPLVVYEDKNFVTPVSLSNEYLTSYFISNEFNEQTNYLAKLVGLVRSKKITKEELDSFETAYKFFSKKVLENLLESALVEKDHEENPPTRKQVVTIEEEIEPKSKSKPRGFDWKILK